MKKFFLMVIVSAVLSSFGVGVSYILLAKFVVHLMSGDDVATALLKTGIGQILGDSFDEAVAFLEDILE